MGGRKGRGERRRDERKSDGDDDALLFTDRADSCMASTFSPTRLYVGNLAATVDESVQPTPRCHPH